MMKQSTRSAAGGDAEEKRKEGRAPRTRKENTGHDLSISGRGISLKQFNGKEVHARSIAASAKRGTKRWGAANGAKGAKA